MDSKPSKNWLHVGCSVVAALMLAGGLVMYALQLTGRLPTEDAFRKAAELKVLEVRAAGEHSLVRFQVRNGSKWAMSASVDCAVIDSDGHNLASQAIEVLAIAPGAAVEREARFERREFTDSGLDELTDANIRLSLRWVCEAGREDNVLFR